MGVNLQKSDCYGLDSERKKVLTSSPGPLACAYIHLGVFGSVGTHLPSVKSILPYFSSPRGVAISVSFPEARIRKETVSGLVLTNHWQSTMQVDSKSKEQTFEGSDSNLVFSALN